MQDFIVLQTTILLLIKILFIMKKTLLFITCIAFFVALCVNLNAQDSNLAPSSVDKFPFEYIEPAMDNASLQDFDLSSLFSKGNRAYGHNNYGSPAGYVTFDLDAPNTQTALVGSTWGVYGGDCVEGVLYTYTENGTFRMYESATGSLISEIPGAWTSFMSDMAYDYTTNTMYGSKELTLYTINLATGVPTPAATISGHGGTNTLCLAIDLDGNAYCIPGNTTATSFYSINKTSGVCTLIGPTGAAASYAQCMNFDHNTGILYWCQIVDASNMGLRTINVATGTSTLVSAWGKEMLCFHVEYGEPANICPAVTNVSATQFKGTFAKIAWTAPAVTTDLTGYKIYEGATVLGTVEPGVTTFITNALSAGNHTFDVEATYDEECTPKKVSATVAIKTCGEMIDGVEVTYDANCKATVKWNAVGKSSKAVLWDNGPFITHPGQGAGGADVAAFTKSNVNNFGSNANQVSGFIIADDFVLETSSVIETIDFYTYQTGSGNTSTINGVYVTIYNGAPNAGGTIVWGNQTTNRMVTSAFSNIYRTNFTAFTNTDRPLMKVTAGIEVELPAGAYWVGVSFTGTVASGPWVNPCGVLGQTSSGNGLQYTSGAWQPWIDTDGTSEPQALPFIIYGEGGEPAAAKYNVYKEDALVAEGIEETTWTDTQAVNPGAEVEWCVTQVCSMGGESAAGCVVKSCGDCLPVTNAVATLTATTATITWTPVTGATGYEITRNGTTTPVAAPPYTETGEFVEGTTYEWTIVTVCGSGKSDPVTVGGTLGIDEPGLATFSIVPNPAQNDITIKAGVNFKTIEVINFLGQTVISQVNNAQEIKIDVSNLTNGVYFVRITSENGNCVKKFVKQ